MGISAFVRWTNAPAEWPTGIELIEQRVQELFGSSISRKPFSAVLRTHRPHSAKSEDAATSLLTTVQYPRSIETRNVVFTVEQRDSQWTVKSLPASELLPRLSERKSVYLQPPKVVQEGEFSNVANMTAASTAPSKRAATAQLTPGTTFHLEGVSMEVALGGLGLASGVEWVVRVLSVGTTGSEKGIIVEVEYPPLSSMPSPDEAHDDNLLRATLRSLLPAHTIQPLPETYCPRYPATDWDQPWEEGWIGQERLRRSTWMLVRCLREEGLI